LNHLAKLLQNIIASQKNQHIPSHATIFCNHLAKLLQNSIPENQQNASYATIFWNHLAKLLQKNIRSCMSPWPVGESPTGLGNIIIIWKQSPGAWATLSPFGSAVGNSPLILDESSDHGLGQRYPHLDAARYCSENSPTFQTT
jgi:hypothetical protein